MRRAKSGTFDFVVRDDVVAFVGIVPDRRFDEYERWQVRLDALTDYALGQIGYRQTNVVRAAPHLLEVLEPVQERSRDIADVQVVALEVTFKQDDKAVRVGAI